MKRLIALFLVLALPFSALASGFTKQESYENALELLYDFDAESLETALRFFEDAGSYKDAPLFKIYAEALYNLCVADDDAAALSSAQVCLDMLTGDEEFALALTENGYASCEELLIYVEARKAEKRGDYAGAIEKYGTIRRVLDSLDRQKILTTGGAQQKYDEALKLYEEGKYWEAGLIFKDINWLDSEEKYADCVRLHEHRFTPATCETPSVCEVCGEVLGEALGHDYAEATCETPETCTRCGATSGEALGHDWQPATLEAPATCKRCGATSGEKLVLTYAVGDIYTFGAYEQDNDLNNGKEPIEWIILDVADDGALTLMSKYALDYKRYNDTNTDVTWETCTLREWLNHDFLNAAFRAEELAKIQTVTLENENSPNHGTSGGNDTQDKVWLLSINEVWDYYTADKVYSFFTDNTSRICLPTEYTVAQGAFQSSEYTVDGVGTCLWWLRSPAYFRSYAAGVHDSGNVVTGGYYVSIDLLSVRPVIRIQPSV